MQLISTHVQAQKNAPSQFEALLGHHPQLGQLYRTFYLNLTQDAKLDPRVVELCRRRIAHIHNCRAELALTHPTQSFSAQEEFALEAGRYNGFTLPEQSALQIAELISFNHHAVSDGDVARLQSHFGNDGTVTLLSALAFFDVMCRTKIALNVDAQEGSLNSDYIA